MALVRRALPSLFLAFSLASLARPARAAGPTPGYPEAVVQWGVQKGETCEDIAKVLYGSAKHVLLLQRYNRVTCAAGVPLREGMTLVLPEKVTVIPDAKLRSMNPDVRARPGGGGWSPAAPGMPLYSNSNVNTLDLGRADIEFVDRTRVFLAPNTLVVIYGTANQTRVSKTPPPAVEVDEGEVKAGLSALRGGSVEVSVKSGGRVSAASRDTVVQQKGDRTTVAVFDGKAGVKSGGKSVEVPKDYGTRFVGAQPPAPPRPLPPAPTWAPGGTEGIVLAPGGQGRIEATWSAVPVAVAYRVELGRDAEFNDLVAREEVKSDIHAFLGEKLPPGVYHLRVRAIDKEEYLGIASADRVIRVIQTNVEMGGGKVLPRSVEANPYGILRLAPSPDMEMAMDQGAYGPMLESVDLQKQSPKQIHLRPKGTTSDGVVDIHYTPVGAAIAGNPAKDLKSLDLRVTFSGLDGIDVPTRVAPSVRVQRVGGADKPRAYPLSPVAGAKDVFGAKADLSGESGKIRMDVVDGRGAVLGTSEIDLQRPAEAPPPKPAPRPMPVIGVTAPLWQISPLTDVQWTAPTAENAASMSGGLAFVPRSMTAGSPKPSPWGVEGQVRASGQVGPVGIDAAIRSNTSGDISGDASAWLGVRVRALRLGEARFELAPVIRLGIPTLADGAAARLEPAVALGGVSGRFTWIADVGARVRLVRPEINDDLTASRGQGFLLAGGTIDLLQWLRVSALLDAHYADIEREAKGKLLGGLTAGIEAGRTIFGALCLRASPLYGDGEGPFTAQLTLGVREFLR